MTSALVPDARTASALRSPARSFASPNPLAQPADTVTALVDALVIGAVLAREDGMIVHANTALGQLLELGRHDLVGLSLSDLVHPDDLGDELDQRVGVLTNTDSGDMMPMRLRHADGASVRTRRRLVVLDGLLFAQFERFDGTTPLAVEAAEVGLSGDDLLAAVSHELGGPTAAVHAALCLLEEETLLDESQRRIIDVARRNTTLLARLGADLVDEAAAATGHLSVEPLPVRASTLLAAAAEGCAQDADTADVTLRILLGAGVTGVNADTERIGQVFTNLMRNAIRCAPGGTVTLAADRADVPGFTTFSVTDDGPGIPAELLDSLFERGVSGTGAARGRLGVGLWLCRCLIEAHGGSIAVTSTPGDGTTFRFTLPSVPMR